MVVLSVFLHSYIDAAVVAKFSVDVDEVEGKSIFFQDGIQYFMLDWIKSFHKIYKKNKSFKATVMSEHKDTSDWM